MSDFHSPCNESEVQLLEQLAREHPKDVKVVRTQTPTGVKLNIETANEKIHNYLIFMLKKMREEKERLNGLFKRPEWDYDGET